MIRPPPYGNDFHKWMAGNSTFGFVLGFGIMLSLIVLGVLIGNVIYD